MYPLEGYQKIAQLAGSPDDGRKRKEMLDLAISLMGPKGKSAAFLWLIDEEKRRFHLDAYEPMDPERYLARIVLDCAKNPEDASYVKQLTDIEKKKTWFRERIRTRNLFEVKPHGEIGGYLEVLNTEELVESTRELLRTLADAVGARITRHRDLRLLKVYKDLTQQEATKGVRHDGKDYWPKVAARVAKEMTSAELALVFRPAPDLSLRAVATEPDDKDLDSLMADKNSLINQVFKEKLQKRILDHTDAEERCKEFGTDGFDRRLESQISRILLTPLRSWISAVVTCDNEPVAVLVVANKQNYLPEVFSGTDFEIVKGICSVLSSRLAQAEANRAVRRITDYTLKNFDASHPDSEDEKKKLRGLLDLVQEHVPGIVAGAVTLRVNPGEQPEETWALGELVPGAMDILKKHLAQPFRMPSEDNPQSLRRVQGAYQPDFYVFEQVIPNVGNERVAALHLLSRRQRLANFEVDVLRFLGSDLGQLKRSENLIRWHFENLVQIRHALRSGLQGIQHVENAWEVYEAIAKRGMSPSDFRIGMLRRSLEWTRHFATRCRFLIEESRFLLDRITPKQLRIGGSSIGNLVKEMIACLRPDAEDREVEFDFQNQAGKYDEAAIDHLLISISIFNILDNAVKYSHRNQTVYVRLTMTPLEWKLEVKDTGALIREQDYEIIFAPMVRRTTGQAQHTRMGTGLGLAIVQKVMEAHGGRVLVRSLPLDSADPEAGAETVFTIVLPRKRGKSND